MSLQDWVSWIGRFHLVVVHFPIALLLAALVLHLRRGPGAAGTGSARTCAAWGAASAVLAALLGWAYASPGGGGEEPLSNIWIHRWAGVAAAGCAVLALMRPRALVAAALLVCVAGHYGARMVHGNGYLSLPVPPGPDFTADVLPILEGRCVMCHGARRAKADLRLDSHASVMAGSEGGPVVVPGDALSSNLYRMVTTDDPKHRMPFKKPALAPAQIETLRAWIEAGAPGST